MKRFFWCGGNHVFKFLTKKNSQILEILVKKMVRIIQKLFDLDDFSLW